MNEKKANSVLPRVKSITSAKTVGVSLDAETSAWLRDLPDEFYKKLAKTGIISPRLTTTLGDYCNQFLAKIEAKESTKRTMKQTKDTLIKHFGYEADPKSITVEMVEHLSESMKKARISPSTIDKRIKTARQIFDAMIRAKIIHENPFKEVKVTPTINEERNVYIEGTSRNSKNFLNPSSTVVVISFLFFRGGRFKILTTLD